MISISHLKPFCEACNIASVNQVTTEQECLQDSAQKRVKTFVGITVVFAKVISKLSQWQNFAVIRKSLEGTTTVFAECCHKFRGLRNLTEQRQYRFCSFVMLLTLNKSLLAGWSAGLNKLHAGWWECMQCARSYVHINQSKHLRSTLLFKVASSFCVWKQIIFGTRRSDFHNIFQLRSCFEI